MVLWVARHSAPAMPEPEWMSCAWKGRRAIALRDDETGPEAADVTPATVAPESCKDEVQVGHDLKICAEPKPPPSVNVFVCSCQGDCSRSKDCYGCEEPRSLKVPTPLKPVGIPGELGDHIGMEGWGGGTSAVGVELEFRSDSEVLNRAGKVADCRNIDLGSQQRFQARCRGYVDTARTVSGGRR